MRVLHGGSMHGDRSARQRARGRLDARAPFASARPRLARPGSPSFTLSAWRRPRPIRWPDTACAAPYVSRMSNETDGRSQRERMLAGDPYIANDPELPARRAAVRCRSLRAVQPQRRSTTGRAPADPDASCCGSVGAGGRDPSALLLRLRLADPIGARTFANFNFVALDVAPITIGEDVQIGPNVQLLTPTHPIEPEPRRAKIEAAKPITIGDNVWLGGGVIVGPGVTIGENTVVGAGAVVVRDLPANVVAVGNPARIVRQN